MAVSCCSYYSACAWRCQAPSRSVRAAWRGMPMHPAAHAQTAPLMAPFGRPPDQPSAYSPIPQRLIADLHDNMLAIGLYGFIARLYLVAQAPIPLSVPDVLRYDPALSRGAVLRALARLVAGGYVIAVAQPGRKTRYTPA